MQLKIEIKQTIEPNERYKRFHKLNKMLTFAEPKRWFKNMNVRLENRKIKILTATKILSKISNAFTSVLSSISCMVLSFCLQVKVSRYSGIFSLGDKCTCNLLSFDVLRLF